MPSEASTTQTYSPLRRLLVGRTHHRERWALIMLFTASALNLLDRQIVNILAQKIKEEMVLSDTQLGMLTGLAFGIFYALLGIPMSRLADRFSRTGLIGVSVSVWSGFTMACGLAGSFPQLLIARLGVGVGEAGAQPAATSLIMDYFPPEKRGLAMSIFFLGVPFGGCLGLLLGAAAGSHWSWREAFLIAGAPGQIIAILLWLTLRDPRDSTRKNPSERTGIFPALRELIGIRSYRLITLAAITGASIINITSAWLPTYFIRIHHLSMIETALWMSVGVIGGGSLGSLGGGWLCDRLRERVRHPALTVLIATSLAIFPLMMVTTLATSTSIALIAMVLTNICSFSFLPLVALLVQTISPPGSRGLAMGLVGSTINVVSLTVALPLVGVASDLFTKSYGAVGLGYAVALAAPLGLIGAAFYTMAWKAMR
jgi:predicted MFS family arabinose efflux permease